MEKVSLVFIAQKLGVSKSLVSAVLNGKEKESRISKAMTEQVIKLAKELNYQPNLFARGLRTGRSFTLGVIVADISNPFFSKICREIEDNAATHHYRIIFCSTDEQKQKFASQLNMLKGSKVDGLIMTPPEGSDKILLQLEKENIPVVIIDRFFSGSKFDSILINNYESSFNAVRFLIKKGYKRIGIINIKTSLVNMQDRTTGYTKGLLSEGVKFDKSLVKELAFSQSETGLKDALTDLIAKGADAVLFATSKLGSQGLRTIKELNLLVPKEIAIISFDDTDYYNVSFTTVTAIAQPIELMSKKAVESIMDQIQKKKPHLSGTKIELATEFILRESC